MLAQRDLSCGVTNAVRQDVPLILLATLVAVPRHTRPPQQVDRARLFVLPCLPAVTKADAQLVETERQAVSQCTNYGDTSLGIAIGYVLDSEGSIPGKGERPFSVLQRPDRF